MAQGVCQRFQPLLRGDLHAVAERFEVERLQVDLGTQRRVGGVDQLEPAVDQVAVHRLGAHAATHRVLFLHDQDTPAGLGQNLCRGESGHACAHHNYVECSHSSQGSCFELRERVHVCSKTTRPVSARFVTCSMYQLTDRKELP